MPRLTPHWFTGCLHLELAHTLLRLITRFEKTPMNVFKHLVELFPARTYFHQKPTIDSTVRDIYGHDSVNERERADFLSPKEPRLTRSLKERLKKIWLAPERPSHRSEPVSRSNVPVHFSELSRSEPLTEVSRFAHLYPGVDFGTMCSADAQGLDDGRIIPSSSMWSNS